MRKRRVAVAIFSAIGVAAVTASVRAGNPRGAIQAHTTERKVAIPPLQRALRPNYPYSVVPGGVYAPDELRRAIGRDPQLREHYAGINLNALRLVKLTTDRYVYVSFRAQGGGLFWTRNRLRVPAGEVLLTDGQYFVKTRCGNRLSDDPAKPGETRNIASATLSPPPLTEENLAQTEFEPTPAGVTSSSPDIVSIAQPSEAELSQDIHPFATLSPVRRVQPFVTTQSDLAQSAFSGAEVRNADGATPGGTGRSAFSNVRRTEIPFEEQGMSTAMPEVSTGPVFLFGVLILAAGQGLKASDAVRRRWVR